MFYLRSSPHPTHIGLWKAKTLRCQPLTRPDGNLLGPDQPARAENVRQSLQRLPPWQTMRGREVVALRATGNPYLRGDGGDELHVEAYNVRHVRCERYLYQGEMEILQESCCTHPISVELEDGFVRHPSRDHRRNG
jgi:hypothetical protein